MSGSPVWHPFTQHAIFPDAIFIDQAEGAYLYDNNGQPILDAISSWWVNIHGHNHPKIVAAVQAQAARLDQVIFAGFTHAPAEALAGKLIQLAGAAHMPDLTRVFFSDSGSTSVEVALKMALGYWTHKGQPRKAVVAFEHAYHGDTFGTMSVGGRSVFNAAYEAFLFDVHRLPCPAPNAEAQTIEAFEALLAQQGDQIAALIVEPLVMGAAGMLMYTADTLKRLHGLCRQYGVLFIADEVMTGWGRTGTRFACEQADIAPDILCLSKGMTGGFLPLAVTLATEDIFQAFYSRDRARTFFHSSSFTGNPMACAAACASLDIWDAEPVLDRIRAIQTYLAGLAQQLSKRQDVANVRHMGTILAFDVKGEQGYLADVAIKLYRYFLTKGVLLRPMGDTVYVLPPYCVTTEDLNKIADTIERGLDALRDGALECAP